MAKITLSKSSCNKFLSVLKFVSTDDSRQNIQQVLVEIHSKSVRLVSTNGHQIVILNLSHECADVPIDTEALKFTIPYHRGSLLDKMLRSPKGIGGCLEMEYFPDENSVQFKHEPYDETLTMHTKKHPPSQSPEVLPNGKVRYAAMPFPDYELVFKNKVSSVSVLGPGIGLNMELLKNASGLFKYCDTAPAAVKIYASIDETDKTVSLLYFADKEDRDIFAVCAMRL